MEEVNIKTVEDYLNEVPVQHRTALGVVRNVITDNLPSGYEETFAYNMISYVVPLDRYPKGYLGDPIKPLPYAGLASVEGQMELYLLNVHFSREIEEWFRDAYKRSDKLLQMRRGRVRFKSLGQLAMEVVEETIAMNSVEDFITLYENWERQKRTRR